MSRKTFNTICTELRPFIERDVSRFRQPVCIRTRVAVTLWRLATNIEYRTIAELFGLGRSTVCEIVIDTCDAIAGHLAPRHIYIPQNESLKEVVDGFEWRWGFPQAAGAIDGTHIPILKPHHSAADYYCRKGYYSLLMQALVDYRGIFMNVYIGWPGKTHDARVFANSSVYADMINDRLFPNWTRQIEGIDVPLVILGDPAYPLLPWLMKPYLETPSSTQEERAYNYYQSRARMVVENAFGRLKGRWRCLMKRFDCDLTNVPNVVLSCVVLHNMCERAGDSCEREWILHEQEATVYSQTPSVSTTTEQRAISIRNAIKSYISQ